LCYTRQEIIPETEQETEERTHGVRCCNTNCGRSFAVMHCVPCRIWRDFLGPDGLRHCNVCERCYPSQYFYHHYELCSSEGHAHHHDH
jgi:hypothetical protein